MATRTIVGSFDSLHDAQRASDQLQQRGLAAADLSVIANNTQRGTGTLADDAPATLRDDGSGAATGAAVGGVAGGLTGLAAGLMGLAVPGIGPVLAAGSLFTALAGAGAGALTGGLIGALTDTGLSEEEAGLYAENVRRGGALLIVRCDETRATEVSGWLRECGAIDIQRRAQSWRDSGWSAHDPAAAPYGWDEIERERARYGTRGSGLGAGMASPGAMGAAAAAGTPMNTGSSNTGRRTAAGSSDDTLGLGGSAAETTASGIAGTYAGSSMPTGGAGGRSDLPLGASGSGGALGADLTPSAGSRGTAAGDAASISSLGGRSGVSLDRGASQEPARESARGFGDWGDYDSSFRGHHASTYGSSGDYERYAPAYQYGGDLNRHSMYRGRQWDDIEPDVRRDWESRNPGGVWESMKAAVRHGWEATRNAAEHVIPGDSDRDGR